MDVVGRTDPVFCAAFYYFLQENGWSVQEFCERTADLSSEGGRMLIHPSTVSDWKKRTHPSNQNVIITCATLGVSRADFFHVGEELQRMQMERKAARVRRELASEKDVEALAQAVANLRDPEDLEGVKELERAVRAQRERLEAIRKG